ncbi:unnamed protein product [Phytophthora fragariaefolia]|uniref:Unnamed protein product n=1 Tax=Phytophthora fragariaefolia TaxID=1490495 RepID=A0A9W6XA19_9STRA|nr:unnamed protein product [Phytophthora fragariaefolia]
MGWFDVSAALVPAYLPLSHGCSPTGTGWFPQQSCATTLLVEKSKTWQADSLHKPWQHVLGHTVRRREV